VVVYIGNLELRGRGVIINHGRGVMSAYFHLSDIFVAQGDSVTPGQVVAAGGSTGLSTGPHLHWDLRIMDIPVNPLQWTETAFP
jgi:murein DD-endopeptidase MepM/ murein hydrolase activator NlpD